MKPFLYEGEYICYPMVTVIEQNRVTKNRRLQEIILFDYAESTMGLGQVNFRKTSSFCGPGNSVNGINFLDGSFCPESGRIGEYNKIEVYNYKGWDHMNKSIVQANIKPGDHICCAGEMEYGVAGDEMYAGIGIAIPKDDKNAILFMESVGKTEKTNDEQVRNDIIKSVEAIGLNQHVEYEKVYVVTMVKRITTDLGCAMVAIPYFAR